MLTKPIRTARGGVSQRSPVAEAKREFNRTLRTDARRLVPAISETLTLSERIKGFHEVYEGDGYTDANGDVVITAPQVDKSITSRQFLRILAPHPTKIITLPAIQYDRKLRRLVYTTNDHIVEMSDTSLLRQGNPFGSSDDAVLHTVFKRETSRSKRIEIDADAPTAQYKHWKRSATSTGVDSDALMNAIEARQHPPKGKQGRTSGAILSKHKRTNNE